MKPCLTVSDNEHFALINLKIKWKKKGKWKITNVIYLFFEFSKKVTTKEKVFLNFELASKRLQQNKQVKTNAKL